MRKLFSRIVLLAFIIVGQHMSASAQDFRFGATAGMNVSSVTSADSRIGYRVGVKGEYAISNGWYAEASLLLSSKGYKDDVFFGTPNKTVKDKCSTTYLELPIHAGYKFNVSDNLKLFVNAGPYVAYGLWGKDKVDDKKVSGNVFSDGLNRFDWGLGANVGVEISNHLQISAGYDWGLKEITKHYSLDRKNRAFNVSCSYVF